MPSFQAQCSPETIYITYCQ